MSTKFKAKALDVIRDRIIYLEYKPGAPLNEKEIASELGISRTPVREAMIQLKIDGLVEIIPRSGTYVKKVDLLELKNCYVVRSNLEGLVAELAAVHILPQDISRLEDIVEKGMKIIADDSITDHEIRLSVVQLDSLFHEILYASCFNDALIEVLKMIGYRCRRGWYSYINIIPETITAIDGINNILDAIKRSDRALARTRMMEHVNGFIEQLQKKIN